MPKILVVFSDTHCGSRTGLMGPTHNLIEEPEVVIKASPGQLWLHEAWNRLWDQVNAYIDGRPWVAACVGDAIEGLHHGKMQLVTEELADHYQIFMDVVYPKIQTATKRIFVLGTSCHTGNNEMILAKKCKAVKHPDSKRYAENRWLVNVGGTNIVLRHHINVTSREHLRTNALSINLANEQLAAIRRGWPVPMGLVVGHRHVYDYIDDGTQFCLVCGPWQLTTRFGHKNFSPMAPEPTLSIIDGTNGLEVVTFKATPEAPKCLKL